MSSSGKPLLSTVEDFPEFVACKEFWNTGLDPFFKDILAGEPTAGTRLNLRLSITRPGDRYAIEQQREMLEEKLPAEQSAKYVNHYYLLFVLYSHHKLDQNKREAYFTASRTAKCAYTYAELDKRGCEENPKENLAPEEDNSENLEPEALFRRYTKSMDRGQLLEAAEAGHARACHSVGTSFLIGDPPLRLAFINRYSMPKDSIIYDLETLFSQHIQHKNADKIPSDDEMKRYDWDKLGAAFNLLALKRGYHPVLPGNLPLLSLFKPIEFKLQQFLSEMGYASATLSLAELYDKDRKSLSPEALEKKYGQPDHINYGIELLHKSAQQEDPVACERLIDIYAYGRSPSSEQDRTLKTKINLPNTGFCINPRSKK